MSTSIARRPVIHALQVEIFKYRQSQSHRQAQAQEKEENDGEGEGKYGNRNKKWLILLCIIIQIFCIVLIRTLLARIHNNSFTVW